ncbi:MAG: hypothetical protein ISP90_07240 [Nevskia sp.]|nr:hypothetical protein [Nevskia sp.]
MVTIVNPQAESHFARQCARDEVGSAFIESLKGLGEYELRGELRVFRSPYVVTAGTVFGGAAGMAQVYYRLRPDDCAIALRCGADPAAQLGPGWVCFTLFRRDWPRPGPQALGAARLRLRAQRKSLAGN